MYSCNHDLCNVERNMCEDCELNEDLDVCRSYSKPNSEGSESNENDTNDAKNVTKIDTNQAFTITLNVFLFHFVLCFLEELLSVQGRWLFCKSILYGLLHQRYYRALKKCSL